MEYYKAWSNKNPSERVTCECVNWEERAILVATHAVRTANAEALQRVLGMFQKKQGGQ